MLLQKRRAIFFEGTMTVRFLRLSFCVIHEIHPVILDDEKTERHCSVEHLMWLKWMPKLPFLPMKMRLLVGQPVCHKAERGG